MKLKQLEIQGFKSFDDQTIVKFDQNITGIVGPNGCGKSNVVDAIRWVMGEQSAKHLRGRSMEDIIFSGTQTRQANTLAGVELTFINDGQQIPPQYAGCEEVSIGRKLYRTGESEYFINRQPCRLKDVTDFFLGTGAGTKAYSIIEQGRVGQVVTSKPEQRRGMIEEAAGISKFKARKDAAQRRMESTQQNLSRLTDIILEIERQKNTLERQAKKAEKYRVVYDELKTLDLKLASLAYHKSSDEQQALLQSLKESDAKQVDLEAQVSESETWIEEERLKLADLETKLSDIQQKVYDGDNSLKLAESKLSDRKTNHQRLSDEIKSHNDQLDDVIDDIQNTETRLDDLSQKVLDADIEFETLQESEESSQTELQTLTAESEDLFKKLEEARDKHQNAKAELSKNESHKQNLRERLEDLQAGVAKDQDELDTLTKNHKEISGILNSSKKNLGEIKQLKLVLNEKTDSYSESLASEKEKIEKEQAELSALKEELMQKKSRLESLEELQRNFEGYQKGPKEILKHKQTNEWTDVVSSVADLIETDSEYEAAVSAVLGDKIQAVVVKNQGSVRQCLDYLQTQSAGRSSFYSMDLLSEPVAYTRQVAQGQEANVLAKDFAMGQASNSNTTRAFLADRVRVKEGYDLLKQNLFGDVCLVENFEEAIEFWSAAQKPVVAKTGEYIMDGVITGGTVEGTSKALLEKKREIKDLTGFVKDLVNQVKAKEELCLDLKRKIKTLQAELDDIQSSRHQEELNLAKQEKDVSHFSKELESMNQRRGKLAAQIFESGESISRLTQQLQNLDQDQKDWEVIFEETFEYIQAHQDRETQLKNTLKEKQEAFTQLKVNFAKAKQNQDFLKSELERLTKDLADLHLQRVNLEEQVTLKRKQQIFIEDRIAYTEKNIHRLMSLKDNLDANYTENKNQYSDWLKSISEREMQLKDLRREASQLKDLVNKNTVQLTELRANVSRVAEQTLERYQVVLSEVYKDNLISEGEEFDISEAEERAGELRRKVQNMGSVNLAAIDELNEISERYEFLTKQKADLEESLASLERAIQKINRTTKERFATTFELVNEKFKKLYPRLFKGGEAYLEMTDPDNVLETGIEIIAQPPGKKLQSINLLSGGEKALTAVSLLFAIFLIKPAPFCLLDEVDAPLDDANVDRYNEIVKEMSKRTQFIVITHNKRTMQVTDCLFGVTMQEPGVSRLVSVQLEN